MIIGLYCNSKIPGLEWMSEYCFTSISACSAQSWQYHDRRKPEAGTMPYSYFEWLQGFFIVHSTIGSTVPPSFEQFGALYMHNHENKYPARWGFEPGTSRLQALVDTNEPSGSAFRLRMSWSDKENKYSGVFLILLPPPKRLCFWSCWIICLAVYLSDSRIIYRLINGFAWNFDQRWVSGQSITFGNDPDYDSYPGCGLRSGSLGGGFQSLADCLV